MPIPARLTRKLQDTLGAEPAEDLVTWMTETDSLRGDITEFEHKMELMERRMDARFERLDTRIDQLRAEVLSAVDKRSTELLSVIDKRSSETLSVIDKRSAELMKWSFLFWVGAVGAIAALAGVLRQ